MSRFCSVAAAVRSSVPSQHTYTLGSCSVEECPARYPYSTGDDIPAISIVPTVLHGPEI